MSAQIVQKSGEGLNRVYNVTIPANDLAQRLEKRIAELAPKMNVKGFRPGKVPAAHVKRMYGKDLMNEIIQETFNDTNQKLLNDNNIRPAGSPEVRPSADMDKVMAGTADLTYEFSVEMMPEFPLMDVSKIKIEKPVYAPSDKDVADTLADLAKQSRGFAAKAGKAADGDQVIIDFVGKIDGVAFANGAGTDAPLVLGSKTFIPGFEDQLVGKKAGDTTVVKVTFPADYNAEDLRGKAAEFDVTVKEVKGSVERKVDDELAKQLGIDSLDQLKELVKGNLAEQYEQTSKFKLKRALLDALDEGHKFGLPPRMVEAEFQAIWQQVLADEEREGRSDEDKAKSEAELQGEYRKIAERRVRLGLVLAEIGRERGINVTDQEVTGAMQQEAINLARQYGMEPQQVFDTLRQNPDFANQVRAPLFEQKVVEMLFSLAAVTEKKVSKDELLAEDDLPEGYGGSDAPKAKKAEAKKAEPKDKAEPKAEDKKAKSKADAKPAAKKPAPKKKS